MRISDWSSDVCSSDLVMYRGEVMERGGLDDIFRAPRHPYLKALLNAVPRFDMKPGERLVPIREIKSEVGRLLRRDSSSCEQEIGKPLLQVEHISKSFRLRQGGLFSAKSSREILAVDDISFTIHRGECLGLVGESGCGKTTASKMIMRATQPDSRSEEHTSEPQSLMTITYAV